MLKEDILRSLKAEGIVAVIRTETPGDLAAVSRALHSGGVRFVEITLTVPSAIDIIKETVGEFQDTDIHIGAGTVLDAAMARAAIDAGSHFIVSPGYDPETVRLCNDRGIVVIPGAFTPSEVLNAWKGGADVVKLFPADLAGPEYIRTIKEPLPHVELLPTKGIDLTKAGAYLQAGAIAVGVASALVSKFMIAKRDYAQITDKARKFAAIARHVRRGTVK